MTLPFGAKPSAELVPGQAPSAPEKPHIVRKMLITSGIAAILFVIVDAIIASGIFSFRDMAG